jgi:hypothetical protein
MAIQPAAELVGRDRAVRDSHESQFAGRFRVAAEALALERLLDGWGRDPAAERELLEFMHHVVAPAFRIAACGWDARDLADDAEQEFWVWLIESRMEPVRQALQGHTAAQLKGFLWTVAARRANRWFRDWADRRNREQKAVANRPSQPPGPTEAEVRSFAAEVESDLTPAQRHALHERLGDEPVGTGGESGTPDGESRPPARKCLSHRVFDAVRRKVIDSLGGGHSR